MNAEEYIKIAELEREHWYYSGKRQFVRQWITEIRKPNRGDLLLDCGAGTGLFAEEMSAMCRVMVLDDHEEALRMLRDRFKQEQIISLAGDKVPLPDAYLEYITALDVLEHTPDDVAVVRGFAKLLKPGGLAVITVPASMALWSDWDIALHHFRRYSRSQLKELFTGSDWEIVTVNYTNVLVYPVVWLARRWRKWFPENGTVSRAEDRMPCKWLNFLLRNQFVGLAMSRLPMPFGVSLLLVARRKD